MGKDLQQAYNALQTNYRGGDKIMSIRLGSRVVNNGELDEELKGKVGTVVARDADGWLLVQFDECVIGHNGNLSIATSIKKGFTSGNNDCWWCSKSALDEVKKGVE